MKAEILTPWSGTGATVEDANMPRVLKTHQLQRCKDITGQPSENLHPDPNLLSVLVECDEATLASIEADSNYLVLWSEE